MRVKVSLPFRFGRAYRSASASTGRNVGLGLSEGSLQVANRFVVDLGEMKLDAAAKRKIANAIQGAVLGQLAQLDAVTSASKLALFDPVRIRDPRWWGIVAVPIGDIGIPDLDKLANQAEQFAGP